MSDRGQVLSLQVSMVVDTDDLGKRRAHAFAIRTEAVLSTNDVWEMLSGALVAVYRNALERQGLTEGDFVDQTLERIEEVLKSKNTGVPTVQ